MALWRICVTLATIVLPFFLLKIVAWQIDDRYGTTSKNVVTKEKMVHRSLSVPSIAEETMESALSIPRPSIPDAAALAPSAAPTVSSLPSWRALSSLYIATDGPAWISNTNWMDGLP